MTLLSSVRDFCRRHGKQRCWIALSGGLDSRVLLDLCHAASAELNLEFHVIHVHHGLQQAADAWAQQCEEYSRLYGFAFHLRRISINTTDMSLEEAARAARYQTFSDFMQTDDLLLTAHHQDDQAETVLLQLFRGAGPKGLAAMPTIKAFAGGWHGRPLLNISRSELLAYANERSLQWIEDPSNQQTTLTRNFIRHDILPLLKSRWPSIEETLARSASHCAEAQGLLEAAANEKLAGMEGSRPGTLSVSKLSAFEPSWQRLLLRSWIQGQGYVLPDTSKISSIQTSVLAAAWDRNPCVDWDGTEVRRHRDDLHILAAARRVPAEGAWEWDFASALSLAGSGILSACQVVGRGLRSDIGSVTVQFRAPGASVRLANRGHLSLKNLLQEWGVPPWERNAIPLIFSGDRLVQALGYYLDPAEAAGEGRSGWELKLEET